MDGPGFLKNAPAKAVEPFCEITPCVNGGETRHGGGVGTDHVAFALSCLQTGPKHEKY